MKHRAPIALASVLFASFAFGQFGPPDPKMIENYKPWFELQNTLNIMLEIDK